MAFAVKNEVSILSLLFRGLCTKKQCSDVVKSRQFNAAACCLSQKNEPQFSQRVNFADRSSTWSSLLRKHQHVCSGTSGLCLQQQRAYAKVAPPQKKKLSFDYSGDLMTQKPLNPQDTHIDLKDISQAEGAAESVQKLCSIAFASGHEKKIHRKEEMKERILHLFGNEADREMHAAMLTVDIRNMIPHVLACRKDKLSKSRLVEKIQLRKKILKYLRRSDYQRFLWLLQELRIRYVLPPDYHKRVTKKYRRKQRVWEAANNLRLQKIAALKAQLEAEKADFLKYKEETLKKIEEDTQRYNLDLKDFEKTLERKRVGNIYPRIFTWEERKQLEEGHPLKAYEKVEVDEKAQKASKKKGK